MEIVTRAELFLQTKFTYQRGQDHRLPYDPGRQPRRAGRAIDGEFARTSRHSITWIVTFSTARPPTTAGPTTMPKSGRQCGRNAMRDARAIGSEQRFVAPSRADGCAFDAELPDFRAEPLLCPHGLGSRSAPVLPRARDRLSGFLVAHRKRRDRSIIQCWTRSPREPMRARHKSCSPLPAPSESCH